MATIKVIKPDETTLNIGLLSGSQEEYNLMGESKAVIRTESATPLNIPIGSKIVGKLTGEFFWLVKSADIVKKNTRDYEYTITFLPLSAKLQYILFAEQADDKQNNRIEFTATMRPVEFLRQIVATIQERLGITVSIGKVTAEDVEKNISFDSNSIYDAMNMIAEAYSTEWQIRYNGLSYEIDLGMIEYDNDNAFPLSYGKDNGLMSGVSLTNGEQPVIKRLYVQGGTRNIDFNKYIPQFTVSSGYGLRHSNNLILPYVIFAKYNFDGVWKQSSRTIQYDGKHFGEFKYVRLDSLIVNVDGTVADVNYYEYPAENGFDVTKAKTYNLDVESLTDENWAGGKGAYIENLETREIDGVFSEVAYKNEEIYPEFETDTDECIIEEGTGNDLGYFTVLHKLKQIATCNSDVTTLILDVEETENGYVLKRNTDLIFQQNQMSSYVRLGYHQFTEGEEIEFLGNLGILNGWEIFNGWEISNGVAKNYVYAVGKLKSNNSIFNNSGSYGARVYSQLEDGKVVAICIAYAFGSGPYTFQKFFSNDENKTIETSTENFPNYQDCIVAGEIPSVVFQSGMLAGKEFKLRTTQSGDLDGGSSTPDIMGFAFVKKSGDTLTKTYEDGELAITSKTTHVAFRMLREDIDNIVMADEDSGFTAKKGDIFAVFNVQLPYVYLANAEVNLLKAAVKYMYENENPSCSFNGNLDANYLINNQTVLSKIRIGEFVQNSDFDVTVRITQIVLTLDNVTIDSNGNEILYDVKMSFAEGRKKESLGSKILRKL